MNRERDWNDAVRESLREAKTPTSDAIWQSIESTLDRRATSSIAPQKRYIWGAVSAVAAAVIVALLLLPRQQEIADTIVKYSKQDIETLDKIEVVDIDKEIDNSDLVAAVKRELLNEVRECEIVNLEANQLELTVQPLEECVAVDELDKSVSAKEQTQEQTQEQEGTASHSYGYYLPEQTTLNRDRRRSTLSLQYAGGVSSNSTSASISRSSVVNSVLSSTYGAAEVHFNDIYNSSKISHHQPLGVGLKFQRELSNRLLIASGVNYTRLVSDLDMVGGRERQQIHFIGLPVILNYRFFSGNNFSLYLGAGGGVEYCVGAYIGNKSAEEHPWHYSVDINLGVEYSLNSWLGLYLEPTLSHYFTETNLRTIRNDSPTTFNIRLGVSFSF